MSIRLLPQLLTLLCCLCGVHQMNATPPSPPDDAALATIIDQLQAEASAVKEQKKLNAAKPDFASRTKLGPNGEQLLVALFTKQSEDSFVDTYVRWQMTSFQPTLPDLEDHECARMLERMPRFIDNPRAHPEALELFTRAEDAGPLSDSDARRLRDMLAEMQYQTQVAEHLNQPAEQFWDWVAAELGDDGPHPHLLRLARCRALVFAGWPVRSIKGKITRSCSESTADPSFTHEQRLKVAAYAREMAKNQPNRRFVDDVAFMRTGRVKCNFSTVRISTNDAERWANRLFGLEKSGYRR